MVRRIHATPCGNIQYWISIVNPEEETLVLLPGLTADHRLFRKQIEYFEGKRNLFVWDAPGHAASRPFALEFTLMDKAKWLHDILVEEGITAPVIVGQSMGGYVGQAFAEQFPGMIKGFISIDSAPLQRRYMTGAEIWMLRHVEPIYRMYPWKRLLRDGSYGCAETEYGRLLMCEMMMTYSGNPKEYCRLAGHGFGMLADAVAADRLYEIPCPALLICGEKDKAGSAKAYNRKWHNASGIPIEWIPDAGHNANTDAPEVINERIEKFVDDLK